MTLEPCGRGRPGVWGRPGRSVAWSLGLAAGCARGCGRHALRVVPLPVGAELEAGELALGPWPTPSGIACFLPLLTPEISKPSGGEKVR